MSLNLHRLWMPDVKVLMCSLLRSVLRVLWHGTRALLRWGLQHHELGLTVVARMVWPRHGSLDVGLCDLPQRVGLWDALVTVDAVTLDGVRPLRRRVSRGHVGGRGCSEGARVVQGLLGAGLGVLSRTGGGVLWGGLVPCGSTGRLRLMNGS